MPKNKRVTMTGLIDLDHLSEEIVNVDFVDATLLAGRRSPNGFVFKKCSFTKVQFQKKDDYSHRASSSTFQLTDPVSLTEVLITGLGLRATASAGKRAVIERLMITGTNYVDLWNCTGRDIVISNSSMSNLDIRYSQIENLTIANVQSSCVNAVWLGETQIKGLKIVDSNLHLNHFWDIKIENSAFTSSNFESGRWTEFKVTNTAITTCRFHEIDFNCVSFDDVVFSDTHFIKPILRGKFLGFQGCSFHNTTYEPNSESEGMSSDSLKGTPFYTDQRTLSFLKTLKEDGIDINEILKARAVRIS